jgi:integral membrane protein (TIGR01906 family)
MNKPFIFKLLSFIFAINIFVIVLFLALIPPAMNNSFYHQQFQINNSYERAFTNEADLNALIDHTLAYTYGNKDEFQYELTLVDGSTRLAFNEREILHMIDVQELFVNGRVLTGVNFLLFVLIGSFFLVSKNFKPNYFKIMRNTILAILLLAALVLGFAALDFNRAFTIFHEIFFSNDLWILSSTDMLIIMLPEVLFFRLAMRIIIGLIIYLASIIGILSYFGNKSRKVKNA